MFSEPDVFSQSSCFAPQPIPPSSPHAHATRTPLKRNTDIVKSITPSLPQLQRREMPGSRMISRKQRWRRVCRGTRAAATSEATTAVAAAAAGGGGIKNNSGPPHPINSLSIDDSLTQRRGTSVTSEASEDGGDATATVKGPSTSTKIKNKDASGLTRRVRFDHRVRVILVPCARELRNLGAQLWWGPDDYLNFR